MIARHARIALVSFFSIASFALAGCSGSDETVNAPQSPSSRMPSERSDAPRSADESAEEGAPSQSPAAEGEGTTTEGNPTEPSGKQPTQPDAQCVASCNTGLKTKCEGDATFCEDVCLSLSAQELSCLNAAPTCEKAEWIRCMPEGSGGSK
jgi:hypothetical protein